MFFAVKMQGSVYMFSLFLHLFMVVVAQLVRALDCGSRGRGFEPRLPPFFKSLAFSQGFFITFITTPPVHLIKLPINIS